MKWILIFLSLSTTSFGNIECKKEQEAKTHVIRGLKETSFPQNLIVGSSTILGEKEPFCRYNIYATWKGLDYEGKEQYYMQHLVLDDQFFVLNGPWLIEAEKVKD